MIDLKLTAHLAGLSGLDFSETQLAEAAEQMEEIIKLMDKVKSFAEAAETYRAEPTEYGCLREGDAVASPCAKKMLDNAKEKNSLGIVVPKVV